MRRRIGSGPGRRNYGGRGDPGTRLGKPAWFDDESSPCDCSEEERDTEKLRSATGYSDFAYYRVRCETCGVEWCYSIEG